MGTSTPAAVAPAFQQRLGVFDATMLVAGTMIGSGIFIVSAGIAQEVGTPAWLLGIWIVTGLLTVAGALSYAEMAAMMPHAGGQYVFLRESYGSVVGFLYGWTVFAVIQTGTIAAVAVAFAKFLGVLVPSLGTDHSLWSSPELNIDWRLRLPWMIEPQSFYKLDSFGISAGQLVGVVLIVLLTGLNCLGVREGKWVQNVFGVAKIFGLTLLIVLGLTLAWNTVAVDKNRAIFWDSMDTKRFQEVHSFFPLAGLAALMVAGGAMVGALFSADAWGNVTFIAGEVRNPRRTLPLCLACGTILVIVLYVLANFAYLADLPLRGDAELAEKLEKELKAAKSPEEKRALKARYQEDVADLGIQYAVDERVGTAALQQASPRLGVPAMAIAIMLSTFGCLNGLVLMGARLYYAMARDGLFFQSVGRLNQRGVPAAGLILQGLWAIVLVFSGNYGQLLDYVIFAALLFYVLTVGGLFVLRRTQPSADRPYRAFGYPIVPAIYVLVCALIMLDLLIVKPTYSWPSFVIIASGVPVYFLWNRRRTA
jgi:APA family basic amino acid/polyamine antiporter